MTPKLGIAFLLVLTLFAAPHYAASERGDANADNTVNSADVVYLIQSLFGGGPASPRSCLADVDSDLNITVKDIFFLINYLFAGGTPPAAQPAETCNNTDDNCDGVIDEGYVTFTCGLGACERSVSTCDQSVCSPGAPSAEGGTCDGVDNDCDGAVDEDCGSCVTVSPTGDDLSAEADGNATPFRTIQRAIDWAVAHPAGPQRVCVASGATCPANATYSGAVVMANGVSVYGKYQATTWQTCASATTVIAPGVAAGVLFPASVTSPTILEGFRIDRALTPTTAAVTVDGATNVVLAGLTVTNTPAVTNSYGVNIVNGGDALIARSRIQSGNGTVESIGVRVVGARVTLRQNCPSVNPATGRCDAFVGVTNLGITGMLTPGAGESYAILLDDSPGSIVDSSATSANDADVGAGIRVRGDGADVLIHGNLIDAWGGALDSHGIWLEDCGGAAPQVVDNEYVSATGDSATTRSAGVNAVGDCHPVVWRNQLLTGGGEGTTAAATAVRCAPNAGGTGSRCVVLANSIRGATFGFPPQAFGIRCEDASCASVTDNVITAGSGTAAFGVWLGRTDALVGRNDISAGCAINEAIGLYAAGSSARIENNFIRGGGDCPPSGGPAVSRALHVVAAATPGEVDIHSNTILGLGSLAFNAISVGLTLDANPGVSFPKGVYRNNIIGSGVSPNRISVQELSVNADPRIFQNNDLYQASPGPLYFNEGSTSLTSAAQVNALVGASGNFSADPQFVLYPTDLHLQATSPCNGAGTSAGAPLIDIDGDARSQSAPDVGADEVP